MVTIPVPEASEGKRERNKRATRAAIEDAAARLFAERGYEHVTVREIAVAAGVTERTFFRYFGGKPDLIVDDVLTWLPRLHELIMARPPDEKPLDALRGAILELQELQNGSQSPTIATLFSEGPPGPRLQPSHRRQWVRRVMSTLTDAMTTRLRAVEPASDDIDLRYRVDVYVGTTVAVYRGALLAHWRAMSIQTETAQTGTAQTAGVRAGVDGGTPPTLLELVDRGFAELRN